MCGEAILNIGGAIKHFLKEKGMSQGDLYRATTLERTYITRLVGNKIVYPRRETLEKITKALNIDLDDLISMACKLNSKKKSH